MSPWFPIVDNSMFNNVQICTGLGGLLLGLTKENLELPQLLYARHVLGLFTQTKSNLIERFIGTDTASVELFFNIFISGTETFVIPWNQILYPCEVAVCRLGLEPLCDTHLVSRELLQIFTVLIFVIYEFYE